MKIDFIKNADKVIAVCPEVLGGLDTPRVPSEIKGAKVLTKDGSDVTKEFEKGAEEALKIAIEEQIDIAILQPRSPSCGKGRENYPQNYQKEKQIAFFYNKSRKLHHEVVLYIFMLLIAHASSLYLPGALNKNLSFKKPLHKRLVLLSNHRHCFFTEHRNDLLRQSLHSIKDYPVIHDVIL